MSINWLTHPLEELTHLRQSLDDTLRNWTGPAPSAASSMDWGWRPSMDVAENKGYYKIILELPNFRREDLDVQVNGRFLSIKGQRMDHSADEWKYHRRERYSGGEFHRAVALPEGIDASSIQAKFQNGVLVLLIPKTGGKNTQHISLMGSEEHSNRRNIIEMEEQERRRRMEENDPMLSRSSWIAGRMGNYFEDPFNRSYGGKQSRYDDAQYRKSSLQDLKLVKSLEQKERERRIKDTKGENEKKKNAQKVSRLIKSLGMNPRSTLRRGGKLLEKVVHLEERERQARIKDKGRQRQHQALAKRVSNLIKNSGGQSRLRHTGFNYSTITKGYTGSNRYNKRDLIFDRFGQTNNSFGSFNSNKFNKFGGGNTSRYGQQMFSDFTHNLEEKERERRLRDKKGQNDAKRLAARISHMVSDMGTGHF